MRIAIVDDLAAERALLKDRLEQQLHRRNCLLYTSDAADE